MTIQNPYAIYDHSDAIKISAIDAEEFQKKASGVVIGTKITNIKNEFGYNGPIANQVIGTLTEMVGLPTTNEKGENLITFTNVKVTYELRNPFDFFIHPETQRAMSIVNVMRLIENFSNSDVKDLLVVKDTNSKNEYVGDGQHTTKLCQLINRPVIAKIYHIDPDTCDFARYLSIQFEGWNNRKEISRAEQIRIKGTQASSQDDIHVFIRNIMNKYNIVSTASAKTAANEANKNVKTVYIKRYSGIPKGVKNFAVSTDKHYETGKEVFEAALEMYTSLFQNYDIETTVFYGMVTLIGMFDPRFNAGETYDIEKMMKMLSVYKDPKKLEKNLFVAASRHLMAVNIFKPKNNIISAEDSAHYSFNLRAFGFIDMYNTAAINDGFDTIDSIPKFTNTKMYRYS